MTSTIFRSTAAAIAFVGALALSFPHHLGGVTLGLVTAVVATALGAVLERPLVVVLGALGFFMFDIRGFSIFLRSSDAAIGAGVLGLLVVCVGLWHAGRTVTLERRAARIDAHAHVEPELRASS